MNPTSDPWIYESPDNGDTVYRRRPGGQDRELVREGTLRQLQRRSQLWRDIFKTAESDPELKHMIDQAEVYYRLKHQIQP
jgi:hypothetical protein